MIDLQRAVDDADSHIASVKEMIADYLVIIEMLGRTGQHTAIAVETLESLVRSLRTIEAYQRSLRDELEWQSANSPN